MFHVDSGSLHHIENIGTELAEFIITFRTNGQRTSASVPHFGAITDAVLGNTYDLDAADFAAIRRNTADRDRRPYRGPVVPSTAHFDDPHKFGVEAMTRRSPLRRLGNARSPACSSGRR